MNLQQALKAGQGRAHYSKGGGDIDRLTIYTNGDFSDDAIHFRNNPYGSSIPAGVDINAVRRSNAWYPGADCPRDPSRDQVLELGTGDQCDCQYHKAVL